MVLLLTGVVLTRDTIGGTREVVHKSPFRPPSPLVHNWTILLFGAESLFTESPHDTREGPPGCRGRYSVYRRSLGGSG